MIREQATRVRLVKDFTIYLASRDEVIELQPGQRLAVIAISPTCVYAKHRHTDGSSVMVHGEHDLFEEDDPCDV